MRVTWLDVLCVLTFAFAAYRMPSHAHGPAPAGAATSAAAVRPPGPQGR